MAARPRNLFWYRFCEEKKERIVFTVLLIFSVISELRKSSRLQQERKISFSMYHCKKETKTGSKNSSNSAPTLTLTVKASVRASLVPPSSATTKLGNVRKLIGADFLHVNAHI